MAANSRTSPSPVCSWSAPREEGIVSFETREPYKHESMRTNDTIKSFLILQVRTKSNDLSPNPKLPLMAEQGWGLSVPNTVFEVFLPKPLLLKHLWATGQMVPALPLTWGLRNRPCFCSEGSFPLHCGCWGSVPHSAWQAEAIHFYFGRKEIYRRLKYPLGQA